MQPFFQKSPGAAVLLLRLAFFLPFLEDDASEERMLTSTALFLP